MPRFLIAALAFLAAATTSFAQGIDRAHGGADQ